jgi:hypothetical protein
MSGVSPWAASEVAAAEGAGTVAVLRSMTEKVRLSPVLLHCCAVVHETWVPTVRPGGCCSPRHTMRYNPLYFKKWGLNHTDLELGVK